MSPGSANTFPSREANSLEAQNGSALSNTDYAIPVENRPDDHYDNTGNYTAYPTQTMNTNFPENPAEQYNQYPQYNNGTQTHVVHEFTQSDSRPAGYSTSHTYPQYQSPYYTSAPVYPQGDTMYPTEVSAEDVPNPPVQTTPVKGERSTRDPVLKSNPFAARIYPSGNSQPSNFPSQLPREYPIHTERSDGYPPISPPSPQAQRYFQDQTPEERLRLGLGRFKDQQQRIEYYGQQQLDYEAYLDSIGEH